MLPIISKPGDALYVIVATLTTNRRVMNARQALAEVCRDLSADRDVVLCVWDAQSTWGIEVADYALWAVQRDLEGRPCKWFDSYIRPHLASMTTPWGTA
ncbi:hypothetical protein Msi02_85430 [Microbispora siamensis]|uniref:Uncharacterized protein n=1 Tax=Microbispora siamensis TaxID=564413 RepID=A0ABQ4H227_9ACTN|nr:hypothetical protein Msi02_85430 [Microbispora siamensis]